MARLLRLVLSAVTFTVILAPIAIVVVVAFSPTDYFTFPPPSLSWRWFEAFFRLESMTDAFLLSIQLALVSATVATVLAVLAALSVVKRRGTLGHVLQLVFMAPLLFPTIVLGFALLLFYKTIGMPVTPGLLVAHSVVGLPYCFRTVLASLQSLDPALEEAGQSLGAGPIRTLLLVTLPMIAPGVVSGWLFAFVVSFGELNTALFLTGPGITTLPIEIFAYLQNQGSQLVIAAASALQIGMIVLMVLAVERIIGLGRIIRR